MEDQRDEERRHTAESPGKHLIDLGIREERVDALALPACKGPRVFRFGRYAVAGEIGDILALGDDDAKTSRGLGKREKYDAGANQLALLHGLPEADLKRLGPELLARYGQRADPAE